MLEHTAQASASVLVVCDDPLVQHLLLDVLRASGFEAVAVDSAEEALSVFDEFEPHVVVFDLVLGGMSGIACHEALSLRGEYEGILITGQLTRDVAVHAANTRFYRLVEKPIEDLGEIVSAVRQAAETVALRRENRRLLLCLQDRDSTLERYDHQRRMGSLGAVTAGLVEDMLDPVTVMRVNLEQLHHQQPLLRRGWEELRSLTRARDPLQADALDLGERALKETREIVSECEQSVSRLNRVLRAVRDFVEHNEVAAPGEVEVSDALDAALQLTRGPLRPRCETRVAYGPLGRVWAVRGDVEQVLVSLLMSAADCFEGWGVLEVDGGVRGAAVEVSIGVEGTEAGRRLGALELAEPAEVLERYEGGLEFGRTTHGAQLTLRLPRLVSDAS